MTDAAQDSHQTKPDFHRVILPCAKALLTRSSRSKAASVPHELALTQHVESSHFGQSTKRAPTRGLRRT